MFIHTNSVRWSVTVVCWCSIFAFIMFMRSFHMCYVSIEYIWVLFVHSLAEAGVSVGHTLPGHRFTYCPNQRMFDFITFLDCLIQQLEIKLFRNTVECFFRVGSWEIWANRCNSSGKIPIQSVSHYSVQKCTSAVLSMVSDMQSEFFGKQCRERSGIWRASFYRSSRAAN